MKAPDIIYTDGMNTCVTRPVFSNIDSNIKYIRADLAELTWEDIKKIVDLYEDVYSDYSCNGNGGITNTAEHYQEVLRRFLESKKEGQL